jgi:toxin ParE1/3/4
VKSSAIHEEALAEFDAAIAYYEGNERGVGLRFHAAVQHAIDIIERHPRIGSPHKTTPLRKFVIGDFPYLLFYLDLDELIWIVAIAHGKRKPNYWKERLK